MAAHTDERLDGRSRPAAIALSMLTLRLMENWHSLLRSSASDEAIDLDCTMILLAVVAIGAEKFMRGDLEAELGSLGAAMPPARLNPCNVSSIASATGLNRETARRKVVQLMKAGVLEKERGGGIRLVAQFVGRPEARIVIRAQVDALERAVRQLRSAGVLTGA